MTTITLDIRTPSGGLPRSVAVTARLVAALGTNEALGFAGGEEIGGTRTFVPDAETGVVSMDLVPNSTIVPSGTVYELSVVVNGRRQEILFIAVPVALDEDDPAETYDVYGVLTDPPAAVASSALASHVDVAAQPDPHPQYATDVALVAHAATAHGGAGSYVHTQAVPSDTWSIAHNLNFYPNVSVLDNLGRVVEGDVAYPTINTVTLQFSAAFSGVAYLS